MTSLEPAATSFVPLSEVIAHAPEDREPAPGFVANLHGERVEVTAVLKRTAVIAPLQDRWADKQTARLSDLFVDPEAIRWRPKTHWTGFPAKRRKRYTPEQREALRAASDRRVRADQARQAAAQPPAQQVPAQPAALTPQLAADTTAARSVAAATRQRAVVWIAVSADPTPASHVAPEVQPPIGTVAADLRDAHQRIAALEAELERHRTVERDLLQRIALVTGPRAA